MRLRFFQRRSFRHITVRVCLGVTAAILAEPMSIKPVLSEERPVQRTPGCVTCMATAPGRPASTQAVERDPILPPETVQVEMVLGRLRLVRDRFRIVSNRETLPGGKGERAVQVSFHHGQPGLQARYSDPTEKWTLQFDAISGAHWTREFLVDGKPVKVVYSQRPHRPIEIEVTGNAMAGTQMSGLSVWHLMEQQTPSFDAYVLPSLERLNTAWDLHQTWAKVKGIDSTGQLSSDAVDPETLKQCVADLESADREQRAAALERLRQAGLAAHIPLEKVMQGQLSVQQRQTVERLLDGLEPRTADTPTRLVYWLSGDSAWR